MYCHVPVHQFNLQSFLGRTTRFDWIIARDEVLTAPIEVRIKEFLMVSQIFSVSRTSCEFVAVHPKRSQSLRPTFPLHNLLFLY